MLFSHVCRRAKRLKKLNRMVQSSAAQQATTTWRRHTLVLLGIILLAHIVCFAVLTTQIDKRYANSQVGQIVYMPVVCVLFLGVRVLAQCLHLFCNSLCMRTHIQLMLQLSLHTKHVKLMPSVH